MRELLRLGAAPNPTRISHTALRGAALHGHTEVCTALLEARADPNFPSQGCRTPLMGSAMNGHLEATVALLEAKANVQVANDFEEQAIDLARKGGHGAIVEVLSQADPDDSEGNSSGGGGGGEVSQHSNPLMCGDDEEEEEAPSKDEAIAQVREMRGEMEGIRGQMSGLQTELVELSRQHQSEMKDMMQLLVAAIANVQKKEHEEMLASIRREVEEEEFGAEGAPPQFATDTATGERYELAEWAKDANIGDANAEAPGGE